MNCIVTAGPTYEDLDQVRRLTNFSTGKLGSMLANYLVERGHTVTLLLGYYATWRGEQKAQQQQTFTTTADLRDRLQALSQGRVGAVFHAAAVSDFTFGRIWSKSEDGTLTQLDSPKIATRGQTVLAELTPTPKILRLLRGWYRDAAIIGWKYELEGGREDVLAKARQQIEECGTTACVANGKAYGLGFGLVAPGRELAHYRESAALFEALERMAAKTE